MQDTALWTFARFDPGQDAATIEVALDESKRAEWQAVFGDPGDVPPRGMLVVAMTQAYIGAFQPRPSGNIHAGQVLDFTGARPAWGDRLSVTVTCAAKEERKGRYWIDFRAETRAGDELLLTGTFRTIWAA